MSLAYHPPLFHRKASSNLAYSLKVVLKKWAFLALALGLLLSAEAASAQDIFGRISGTVTDPTGAAVTHAKVTIANQDTNRAPHGGSGAANWRHRRKNRSDGRG